MDYTTLKSGLDFFELYPKNPLEHYNMGLVEFTCPRCQTILKVHRAMNHYSPYIQDCDLHKKLV